MRKRSFFIAAVFLFLLTTRSVCYSAEAIKLRYSQYFPPTFGASVLTAQFCEEIKKRTNGRVDITHYAGGTLTTAPKMFQGVVGGVSDLGWGALTYNQGRFPVTEACDLPLGRPNAWVATHVSDDFFRKFEPKEWDSVHVLFLSASGPNIIYTSKKPVKTLEELKGMKIRGMGKVADELKLLGATPVPIEAPDMYEAMRRGVTDGNMLAAETLKGFRMGELAKYVTACWRVANTNTLYAVMNKEKWNALPPDIKKIFDDLSVEFLAKHAAAWNEMDTEGLEFFKEHGGQIIQLPDAESRKWEKAIEPMMLDYKKNLMAKGHSSQEVDGYFSYIRERVRFWTDKGNEMGIKSAYQP